MPTSAPLPAVATRIRARGWSHADVCCALDQRGAMAWIDGDALICAWGPPAVVHAVESTAFGKTSALLAEIREELPAALELRAGPGAAGIMAKTHHIELLGPMQRFRSTGRSPLRSPKGLVTLRADDAARVRDLNDKEATGPAGQLSPGWMGVERQGRLLAAIGPHDTGDGRVMIRPPSLHRPERRTELGAELLAAFTQATAGDVVLDIRADRRNHASLAELAGFELVASFERWWCVRR